MERVRGERDFEAYVAARGAAVLRCLLLLELDLPEAEDTATAAFAALRSEWHELAQSADPDVVLWATVLSVESRRRRRAHLEPLAEAPAARVLRREAALEEVQVCEVLGISTSRLRAHLVEPRDPSDDDVTGSVNLHPVPYSRVRAAAWQQRRRRWLVSAAVAAATALAVGVGSWLARPEPDRGPGDALAPAEARGEVNPAPVVWWADGELHLPTAVVRIADVRRLVAAGDGAAYVDSRGRLVGVTHDGGRTLLGQVAPGSALVSSPRLGMVAWADVSVPGVTRLVVWDVEEQHEVAAVVTQPRVRPITFDAGWLRFGQGLRDWAWDPAGGPAQLTGDGFAEEVVDRTALVDAVAGTRLEQWGTFLRVVRAGRRGETRIVGFGGSLSSDGRFALTGPQEGRQPRLHDTRTGDQVPVWRASDQPVAAVFTDTDRVTWLVDVGGSGTLSLLTCGTFVPTCSDEVDLGDAKRALLAGDSRR